MLSEIREHVNEGVSHLARRRERAPVPPIGPKTSTAQDESVDGARDADGDALHASRQRSLVARFDDEMDVIPLQGEVDDSETRWVTPGGGPQREADTREDMLAAQRPKQRAERDVNGVTRRVTRASTMRHVRTRG